jgi:GAF domain-containing protein
MVELTVSMHRRRRRCSIQKGEQMVKCRQCRNVFRVIGDALNARLDTSVMLEMAARSIIEEFNLKACHFRLLSRDQRTLEHEAAYGLSRRFLDKGPVDAERSVAEALEGDVVMVADCVADPRVQYPDEFEAEGIVSLLTIPLETRGQVIGVMRLFTGEPREFSDDEVEFFKVVALFCTSAVIDSMYRRILGRVTESTRSSLDLPDVLDTITRVVCEDLRAKGCAIELMDAKTSALEPRASNGLGESFVACLPDVFTADVMDEVTGGSCVAIFDGQDDTGVALANEFAREGISSILLVPLISRGKAIGVLSVFTNKPYMFSDDEKQLMAVIGEQCSLAIENAKMFAALKCRYETLVDDFHMWFEHSQARPQNGSVV